MKIRIIRLRFMPLIIASLVLACEGCSTITEEDHGDYILVRQKDGPTLGYSKTSNIRIIRLNGKAYKDLNGNGILDTYENWRMNTDKRIEDLVSSLGTDAFVGMMMYSPAIDLNERTMKKDLGEAVQKSFLRHFLIGDIEDNVAAARWMNHIQALCEAHSHGVPAVFGTNPRNNTEASTEFKEGEKSNISHWPSQLGLAATFDKDLFRRYAEAVSQELRALGFTSSITPKVDIASEPRWRRFSETFGESEKLITEFIREYCDVLQTMPESENGWGTASINCMVGSWPGDGKEEGGRDSGLSYGKYSVYPGNNFVSGMVPFVDGALALSGRTSKASAVMACCPISFNQDPSGTNVGNGFSAYIIDTLLRQRLGYDGVICSDWDIARNSVRVHHYSGRPWGAETMSETERILLAYEAGCDQIGGLMDAWTSNKASREYVDKHGKDEARKRFEASARRLLRNMFNVGLFENPYVDVDRTAEVVGSAQLCKAGYDAQLRSVVMLKNNGAIHPSTQEDRRLKIWEPVRHCPEGVSFKQHKTKEVSSLPIDPKTLGKYYDMALSPKDADMAIVCIKSPFGHWGYMPNGTFKEGRYCPISLQYGDYTPKCARRTSIAGGDPREKSSNRSYAGMTEHTTNIGDMELVRNTKQIMGSRPVIVVVETERPFVPSEIEPYADALLLTFGISNQALVEIVSGHAEPSALLPFQMPSDMDTVETQFEDVPRDMKCYTDTTGNTYDFGFGLGWNGVISDGRAARY